MSEKLELRSHHIQVRQRGIQNGSDISIPSHPLAYNIGTPAEREKYRTALKLAAKAVINNQFIDVGEDKRDIICQTCLAVSCNDSMAARLPDRAKREAVFIEVSKSNRYSEELVNFDLPHEEFDRAICNLVDEYWQKICS